MEQVSAALMLSPTAPDQLALLHTTSISELRPVESGALLLLSLHETHTTEAIHTKINVMNLIRIGYLLNSAIFMLYNIFRHQCAAK